MLSGIAKLATIVALGSFREDGGPRQTLLLWMAAFCPVLVVMLTRSELGSDVVGEVRYLVARRDRVRSRDWGALSFEGVAMPRHDRKVIIANTVALNGGDAAILQAEAGLVLQAFGAGTRLVVFDANPEIARTYYPDFDFRLRLHANIAAVRCRKRGLARVARLTNRWRYSLGLRAWLGSLFWKPVWRAMLRPREVRDLEEYRSADLIVYTGGTYLVEHYDLRPILFDLEVVRRLGKPFALLTQSVGAVSAGPEGLLLASHLAQAELILVRDQRSKRNVVRLTGSEERIHVLPDVVFSFAASMGGMAGLVSEADESDTLRVAVSVRSWSHFSSVSHEEGMARYREGVAATIVDLVREHSASVTFVSTCQGVPQYWTDDSAEAGRVIASLPADVAASVTLDRGFRSPQDLVKCLAGFDLVIATRMHMAVLALVAGTPTVAIAYEFKTVELFSDLGLEDSVCDIETMVAGGDLQRRVAGALEHLGVLRHQAAEVSRRKGLEASRMVDLLRGLTRGGLAT